MRKFVVAALASALAAPATFAADIDDRVKALEDRTSELYHTLEEKKDAGLSSKIHDHITVSGLIEIDMSYESVEIDGADDEDASDIVLATAWLGFEAEVNEQVGAVLTFLYEEDDGAVIEVDEAYLNYSRGPWALDLGRQYVPFGAYPSHFVSGPNTSDIGETQEVAATVSYTHDLVSVSAFVFNGDADENGEEDHINDFGLAASSTAIPNLEFGASIISDIADTDGELVASPYQDQVYGYSAYAMLMWGPLESSLEVVGTFGGFDAVDLDADGDGSGDKPFAWNFEVGYNLQENLEVAGRLAGASELADYPEFEFGANVSWGAWENVALSLEYLHGEFDEDFSSPVDSRDLVLAQIAAEF